MKVSIVQTGTNAHQLSPKKKLPGGLVNLSITRVLGRPKLQGLFVR